MLVYPEHVDQLSEAYDKQEPVFLLPGLHPEYLRNLLLEWVDAKWQDPDDSSRPTLWMFEPGIGPCRLRSKGAFKPGREVTKLVEWLQDKCPDLSGDTVPRPQILWLTGGPLIYDDAAALGLIGAMSRRIMALGFRWRLIMTEPSGRIPDVLQPWVRHVELRAPRVENQANENFAQKVLRAQNAPLCDQLLSFKLENSRVFALDDLMRDLRGLDAAAVNLVISAVLSGFEGPCDSPEGAQRLRERIDLERRRQLQQASGLEVVANSFRPEDLQGMDVFRRYLQYVKVIFDDRAAPEPYRGPQARGVLLVGLPGCGKSLAARLTAHILQIPLLKLDVGALMGRYLGESEANLKRALDAAEAAAPCVLWVDEIEKALAGTAGDEGGGTGKRMLGQLLTWMQEHRSQVYLFATANLVKALPPELLRRGRFDELWRVMQPNEDERKAMLLQKLARTKEIADDLKDPGSAAITTLLKKTDKFTGADVESLVQEAWIHARVVRGYITLSHILGVLDGGFVSMSEQFSEKIKDAIKELETHGFRNVSRTKGSRLPPEVPKERLTETGRLVPQLNEIWSCTGTLVLELGKGKKVCSIKIGAEKTTHRPVWFAAGRDPEFTDPPWGKLTPAGSKLRIEIDQNRLKEVDELPLIQGPSPLFDWDADAGHLLLGDTEVPYELKPFVGGIKTELIDNLVAYADGVSEQRVRSQKPTKPRNVQSGTGQAARQPNGLPSADKGSFKWNDRKYNVQSLAGRANFVRVSWSPTKGRSHSIDVKVVFSRNGRELQLDMGDHKRRRRKTAGLFSSLIWARYGRLVVDGISCKPNKLDWMFDM